MRRAVPLSPESNLIEFLKPYRKLSSDQICKTPIDASQLVVWTFRKKWTRYEARRMPQNKGSWCQAYLTSILGLSESQYKLVKKELFAQGLNGVYKHRSQDLYAIVYRPTRMSNSTKAAIAGGLVLAGGLGLAGTRYALKTPTQDMTPTQPASKPTPLKPTPSPTPVPTPVPTPNDPEDLTKSLEDYYQALDQFLNDYEYVGILRTYVPYIEQYVAAIDEQANAVKDVERYRKQIELFEMIANLKMSRAAVMELFTRKQFWEIVSNNEFKDSRDAVCKYLHFMKDAERSRKCRAAVNYLQIRQQLDLEIKEGERNDTRIGVIVDNLQQLSSQATWPEDKSPEFDAIKTLFSTYERSKPQSWKNARMKLLNEAAVQLLTRFEDPALAPARNSVRETRILLETVLKNTKTMPSVSNDLLERRAIIDKLQHNLHFYQVIRKKFTPNEDDPTVYIDVSHLQCLFQRVLALHELQRSQEGVIEAIKKWNDKFESSRHTSPEYNDRYIRFSKIDPNWSRFAGSFWADKPGELIKFSNNEAMVDTYSGYSKVRNYDRKFQMYIQQNMDIHMLNQLRRDLDTGKFKVQDQFTKQLETDLVNGASRINRYRDNNISWSKDNPLDSNDKRWKGAYVTATNHSVE